MAKTEKFMCMALLCDNKVERHPTNFGTGFCVSCQKQHDINFSEALKQ